MQKSVVKIILVASSILLIPLVAMQFTSEVVWDSADFVIAWIFMVSAGLIYKWVSGKMGNNTSYRTAVGVAVVTALILVWVNGAVGIIGNEENPANLMFAGVLSVGVIGALVVRFQPKGMAYTLFATAIAQMLVAVIAQIAGFGFTFIINGFFAALWLTSAFLFRKTAQK